MFEKTSAGIQINRNAPGRLLIELGRIAEALERLSPPASIVPDFSKASAFLWAAETKTFRPVSKVCSVNLDLLCGVDMQMEALLRNTRAFAVGQSANNILLWGARGTGKSSLVKGVHKRIAEEYPGKIVLVEIQRDDLSSLVSMLEYLRDANQRFVVFSDDLSFEANEAAYKSLKAVLDGGIQGRPDNVIFYATSNRRHLLAREMIENERSSAINPSEAVEEKVSLSDRFGLWLGFHATDQDTFLAMVRQYANFYDCSCDPDYLTSEALQWAAARGSRSGRVAFQFIQDFISQSESSSRLSNIEPIED